MSLYTVFGGRGFIGKEFVEQLKLNGHEVDIPVRDDPTLFNRDLGIVVYSAGSGDCQDAPFNVLDANTSLLSKLLVDGVFSKLIYLSSTRLYLNGKGSSENSEIIIDPNDNRRLFNLTKLTSEELCLRSSRDCHIIRPSNVFGLAIDSPLFLPSITRDAIKKQEVNMYVSPSYEKDYIYVGDLVSMTINMLLSNTLPKIINIASGKNTSASDIADVLRIETGCSIIWHKSSNIEVFPVTNVELLHEIIDYEAIDVIESLGQMINDFKSSLSN